MFTFNCALGTRTRLDSLRVAISKERPLPSLHHHRRTATLGKMCPRRASVAATGAMDTARAALDLILTQRGSYVDLVANGDPNVILSSGFQLRANPTPVGDLAAPANLSVELNDTPGLMLLTWEGVEKARAYNLQISPASTPARTWAPLLTSSTTKTRLDDLKLGQLYAFRVAAVGGATGQSPWSIEAVRMAA
jgi:hypothetical protein